jgi:hypothetical protein
MNYKKITVNVRFHDIFQSQRFERCVFSLSINKELVKINILVQNFSIADIENVESLLAKYEIFDSKVINVQGEKGSDLRSKLLNVGLDSSNTELAHFVDFDDLIFQDAYKIISEVAHRDKLESIIYFYRVARAFNNVYPDHDYLTFIDKPWIGRTKNDLIHDNFCPLHSYVLNMSIINKHNLRFDESYEALEDYDFLLRAANIGILNFSKVDNYIGLYNFRNDSSNSTIIRGSDEDPIKKAKWTLGREKIKKLKHSLFSV